MELKAWNLDSGVKVNCRDCSAECCKHIAIPIDEPETWEDLERIKWYISHENVSVYKDVEGDWLVEFLSKCGQLNGNRCMAWGTDKYPRICSEYEMKTCVMNEEGEYWDILFKTAADVDAFAAERGIKPAGASAYPLCVLVPIDAPEEWDDYDDMRWYIAHRDVSILKQGSQWYVHLNTLCKLKDGKHLCPAQHSRIPTAADGAVFATWEEIEEYCIKIGVTPKRLIGKV
jgi:hypothetical protein